MKITHFMYCLIQLKWIEAIKKNCRNFEWTFLAQLMFVTMLIFNRWWNQSKQSDILIISGTLIVFKINLKHSNIFSNYNSHGKSSNNCCRYNLNNWHSFTYHHLREWLSPVTLAKCSIQQSIIYRWNAHMHWYIFEGFSIGWNFIHVWLTDWLTFQCNNIFIRQRAR